MNHKLYGTIEDSQTAAKFTIKTDLAVQIKICEYMKKKITIDDVA